MNKQDIYLTLDALAQKVIKGDADAYRQLITAMASALQLYFRNQFRLGQLAEDLTQETLLAVHTKFHTYRPDQPFTPWLYAIAKYKAIDYLRAQKRRPTETELPPGDTLVAPTVAEDNTSVLYAALQSLSARDRELLTFAKIEGLSMAEIAARMNISLSAVKVGIHRAMKRITGAAERQKS